MSDTSSWTPELATTTSQRPALVPAPALDLLQSLWPGTARPNRRALMQPPGSRDKYLWEKAGKSPLDDTALLAHLAGRATYAGHLIGADGLTRAVVIDVDHGGENAVQAVLEAAQVAGVTAFAITSTNGKHDGGAVWALYRQGVDPEAARAQARTILRLAGLPDTTEIYPMGRPIRLPFGVHTWTERRGELLLQDGRRFDLDAPGGLEASTTAAAALPRNVAPPPLPPPELPPRSASHTPRLTEGRTGKEIIDAFCQDTDLVQLLERYGARVQKVTPDGTRMHCHCPGHKNKDTIASIFVSRAQNRRQVVSGWVKGCIYYNAQPAGNGKNKQFDAFNVYCMHEGLTFSEAVKKLAPPPDNWMPHGCKPLPEPSGPTAEDRAARAADNERHKSNLRKRWAATLAEVRARMEADTAMPKHARRVLEVHLALAGEQDHHRYSVATLAERSGYKESRTHQSNRWLIEHGYLTRKLTTCRTTAVWTLHGCNPDASLADEIAPVDIACDLVSPESVACKGGDEHGALADEAVPAEPAAAPPDALEPPPEVPPQRTGILASQAVCEAFDCYIAAPRLTDRAIWDYLERNYPADLATWDRAMLERTIAAARERRAHQLRARRVSVMDDRQLRREKRMAERVVTDFYQRGRRRDSWSLPHYAATATELERRQLAAGASGRPPLQALLQVRDTGQTPPQELLRGRADPVEPSPAPPASEVTITTPHLPPGWTILQCDYRGNVSPYGIYWLGDGPDGERTEPTQYRDQAERSCWLAAEEHGPVLCDIQSTLPMNISLRTTYDVVDTL